MTVHCAQFSRTQNLTGFDDHIASIPSLTPTRQDFICLLLLQLVHVRECENMDMHTQGACSLNRKCAATSISYSHNKERGHEVDIYADMSRTGSELMNKPWVGEDRIILWPVIQCDLVTFFELMTSGLRNDISVADLHELTKWWTWACPLKSMHVCKVMEPEVIHPFIHSLPYLSSSSYTSSSVMSWWES